MNTLEPERVHAVSSFGRCLEVRPLVEQGLVAVCAGRHGAASVGCGGKAVADARGASSEGVRIAERADSGLHGIGWDL